MHGTNFVGTGREIKEMLQREVWLSQLNFYVLHFAPEHAPHFGGLWEAVVKSFNYCLWGGPYYTHPKQRSLNNSQGTYVYTL